MLTLTLVELTYGNKTYSRNTNTNCCSWILDMADTVRTQKLIEYYENISRTKGVIEKSTRRKDS